MITYPFDESQGSFSETQTDCTPSETFYNLEDPTHDDYMIYINHLEQRQSAIKKAVKELHDETTETLTYYKNKLWKIWKM